MNKRGYIIPVTLMLVAMAVIMITIIYRRGSMYVPFMRTMIHKQQARQLAQSGIQIAMSQLSLTLPTDDKKPTAQDEAKALLKEILPKLNRWQTVILKKDSFGAEGEIQFALTAEEGKIDLNAIFDFKTKKFVNEGKQQGDWKKLMQEFFSRLKKDGYITVNLFESFEQLLKERQYKLNDATELLTQEPFAVFAGNVFYEPVYKEAKGKRPVFLLDMFTTYGSTDMIQPWLFSESLKALCGIKRTQNEPTKEQVASWVQQFTQQADWKTEWDKQLKPVYGIELQSLPNGIDSVLDEKFDPKMFSVVSYGKIGQVTQRAYAIIERTSRTSNNRTVYDCTIKKFYWI